MKSYTITNFENSPVYGLTNFVGLSFRQNFGVQVDGFPSLIPFVGPKIKANSDSDQYVNEVITFTGMPYPDTVEHDNEYITIFYKD